MMMKGLAVVLCLATIQQVSGIIYVRWGRNTCPNSATVLHTGYVGKGHYQHTGSGANYLCLHNKPVWGSGTLAGDQDLAAFIYGVEYQLGQGGGYKKDYPFNYDNIGGRDLHDNDAVCAVCYNGGANDVYMVAGRPDCPSADMTLEYTGYLVSERYTHYRGEFVCLDTSPEARPGGEADLNGGLFYPVQAGCGSLPCPPYVEGNELTCAVCTI